MGRRKGWLLLFLLIILLFSVYGPFHVPDLRVDREIRGRIVFVQDTEKGREKGGTDSQYIQLLKQLKEKVDGWLKSLNERIEREDITRFEVRFLEILRNILEWVKEKIDSKIDSSEEIKPEKGKRELFRDTHRTVFPFFEMG